MILWIKKYVAEWRLFDRDDLNIRSELKKDNLYFSCVAKEP